MKIQDELPVYLIENSAIVQTNLVNFQILMTEHSTNFPPSHLLIIFIVSAALSFYLFLFLNTFYFYFF